jgi:hypothetical protein
MRLVFVLEAVVLGLLASAIGPEAGESDGSGAGKSIPDETKAAALDENKAANGGKPSVSFAVNRSAKGRIKKSTTITHRTRRVAETTV